jgi:hypothetical protein
VLLEAELKELVMVDNLLLAAATAPPITGFVAVAERAVVVPFVAAVLEAVVAVAVLTEGFAGLAVVGDVRGLRAAAAVPEVVTGFLGEL